MTTQTIDHQTGEVIETLPDVRRDLTLPETRRAVIAEIDAQVSLIQEAMGTVLRKGQHYGTIPGTQKPSLWQPGAETLCQMFGFQTTMSRTDQYEDWKEGIFSYTYKCELRDKRGVLITEREATCSSEEVKYKSSQEPRTYRDGSQKAGRPAAELRETLMQMAQKRAYVSAVKASAAASATFSMDDDLVTADSDADQGHGICPVHNVPWFKSERMKEPAHKPVGNARKWCNKSDVEDRIADAQQDPPVRAHTSTLSEAGRAALDAMRAAFPEFSAHDASEWLKAELPEVAARPISKRTDDDWEAVQAAADTHRLALHPEDEDVADVTDG
jgi:hypothetical protein